MSRATRAAAVKPTILWVDDYEPGLVLYRTMFEAIGFHVLTASNGDYALQLAAAHDIDLVVTDYEMPGMDGATLASALKRLKPGVPIVMFSGSLDVPERVRSRVEGVCDKAGSRNALVGAVQQAMANRPGAQALSRR